MATAKRALVAILASLIMLGLPAARSSPDFPALFTTSGNIGVQHCIFPMANQSTDMHLWLRVAVEPKGVGHAGLVMHAKGFAFLVTADVPVAASPAAIGIESAKINFLHDMKKIVLRHIKGAARYSTTSHNGMEDELQLEHIAGHTSDNVTTRPFVLPLWGTFPVKRVYEGQSTWEFQVHVQELPRVCYVLASLSPPLPIPMLRGAAAAARAEAVDGKDRVRTILVQPPLYGASPLALISVLTWHILWHQKLGMDLYVLYFTQQSLETLVSSPHIRSFVDQGVLMLVLFQELPEIPGMPRSNHGIVLNHALTAFPGSIIVVVDVDEFILTPKSTTIQEIMDTCGKDPSLQTGSLDIGRWQAAMSQSPEAAASTSDASVQEEEIVSWMLPSPISAVDLSEHPLRRYHIDFTDLIGGGKSIHRSDHTMRIHVHAAIYPFSPGFGLVQASPECVRVIHLIDLFKRRAPVKDDPVPAGWEDWLWPTTANTSKS